MTCSTRKPVLLLTSRHRLTQVTSWSAFLAALGAAQTAKGSPLTRTHSSLPWSQWNSSCLNYSQGDVENFLSSPLFTFHHWLLLLCFSIADFQPSTLLLFTPGISRQGWLRPSGFFWQPMVFSSNQHVNFGYLSWFGFLSSWLSRSLVLHLQTQLLMQKEPLKGIQLGDL